MLLFCYVVVYMGTILPLNYARVYGSCQLGPDRQRRDSQNYSHSQKTLVGSFGRSPDQKRRDPQNGTDSLRSSAILGLAFLPAVPCGGLPPNYARVDLPPNIKKSF
jgi:hypothetical protein